MERETLSLPVMEPENTYVVFVKELQHVSIHYSIKKKKKSQTDTYMNIIIYAVTACGVNHDVLISRWLMDNDLDGSLS